MSTAKISLRVQPNAAKNEIVGFTDGVFRVKIAAPPVQGKASRELVEFLSEVLGTGKSSLTIVKGHTSHNKIMAVEGLNQEEIIRRLLSRLSSS